MKFNSSVFVVLLFCQSLLLSIEARAEATFARGIGVQKCERLVSWNAQGVDTGDVVLWIYGYWTGMNIRLGEEGRLTKDIGISTVSPEPLHAQILAICRDQPTILIAFAADYIFDTLPPIGDQK